MNLTVVKEIQNSILDEGAVDTDPFKQFIGWYEDAKRAEIIQPEAMHLSTAGLVGGPSGRIVLYKEPLRYGLPENSLLFFTNYQSPKSRSIEENPYVALTFFWKELRRQIRVQGNAQKVSNEISDNYFATRPEGSKLGAWVSTQSAVIGGREDLQKKLEYFRSKFSKGAVPRPEYWGGFTVKPRDVEFWQHRDDRLHDRIWYELQKNKTWKIRRLSP